MSFFFGNQQSVGHTVGVFCLSFFIQTASRPMDTTNQNNSSDNLPQVLTNAVSAIHDRQQTNQSIPSGNGNGTSNTSTQPPEAVHDIYKWRNTLSFWVLGMCNNYGYVVMLSAAIDIINRFHRSKVRNNQSNVYDIRVCRDKT